MPDFSPLLEAKNQTLYPLHTALFIHSDVGITQHNLLGNSYKWNQEHSLKYLLGLGLYVDGCRRLYTNCCK